MQEERYNVSCVTKINVMSNISDDRCVEHSYLPGEGKINTITKPANIYLEIRGLESEVYQWYVKSAVIKHRDVSP